MSMTAVDNLAEVAAAAYRLTTDGAITQPAEWQVALYARLSQPEADAGDLLLAPDGAGKTEAVLIPSLGFRRGGAPHRLFLIGPDGSPLDEPLCRLTPYLRAWVGADETPRTLCLDYAEDDADGNVCRRFFPDGTEDPHIETNPLEADVDLILTTFSRFQSLFFGAGGVHALPSGLPTEDAEHHQRRDLFFFDEAHSYQPDAFARFHRLVEFLFAEDNDIFVASTTMPPAYQEELSFLDVIRVPERPDAPARTLAHVPAADPLAEIEARIRREYFQNARVFGVTESVADAESLYARLASSYPHSVYLYHPSLPADARRRTYAQLRELEKEGEGYLLLTTGDALESSDLDATVLLSTLCPPENLIRRAGRCNRRGEMPSGQLVLVGDRFAPASRPLPKAADYLAALGEHSGRTFDAEFWKAFI
ncbi:MAG: hypothetical protein JO250_00170 [Armatimonadetes bacterium]|nr:hypothetical protein [Armatimonadota bacterium]